MIVSLYIPPFAPKALKNRSASPAEDGAPGLLHCRRHGAVRNGRCYGLLLECPKRHVFSLLHAVDGGYPRFQQCCGTAVNPGPKRPSMREAKSRSEKHTRCVFPSSQFLHNASVSKEIQQFAPVHPLHYVKGAQFCSSAGSAKARKIRCCADVPREG